MSRSTNWMARRAARRTTHRQTARSGRFARQTRGQQRGATGVARAHADHGRGIDADRAGLARSTASSRRFSCRCPQRRSPAARTRFSATSSASACSACRKIRARTQVRSGTFHATFDAFMIRSQGKSHDQSNRPSGRPGRSAQVPARNARHRLRGRRSVVRGGALRAHRQQHHVCRRRRFGARLLEVLSGGRSVGPRAGVGIWPRVDVEASGSFTGGERYYGYFPMGTHLVVAPQRVSASGFVDGAAHRAALPPVYNHYQRADGDRRRRPRRCCCGPCSSRRSCSTIS